MLAGLILVCFPPPSCTTIAPLQVAQIAEEEARRRAVELESIVDLLSRNLAELEDVNAKLEQEAGMNDVRRRSTMMSSTTQFGLPMIPDEEADNCMVCNAEFGIWTRKHHCRSCGRVVCAACSPKQMGLGTKIGRVCNPCYDERMERLDEARMNDGRRTTVM